MCANLAKLLYYRNFGEISSYNIKKELIAVTSFVDENALLLKFDAKYKNIPIIMLTARTQEMDKISGLMLGADDYITKPLPVREVKLRVNNTFYIYQILYQYLRLFCTWVHVL